MRWNTNRAVRWITFMACWTLGLAGAEAESFFRCQGTNILDGNGTPFLSRGLVLSGWLIPEAYGLKLNEVHNRHMNAYTDLRANVRTILGNNDADAKLFWDTYTSNYVTSADLAEFKARGFNSIRVPFNYRLLMSVTNVPDVYLEEGFQFLDGVIQACKTNGLAVLLDMHACPGGQSHDAYADPEYTYWSEDQPGVWIQHGVAVLWESNATYYADTGRTPETNKQRTVDLWKKIAQRYSNETAILGYELINEPYFYTNSVSTNDMRDLFIRITSAIREVDTNHIVFVEGNIFAEFIDGLTPPWDNNMAIAFHRYWRETGYEDGVVQSYLDARSTYNVPLLMTESGENSNPWIYEIKQLMESNRIGCFWWGFKKVDANSVVYHVQKTPDYQYVIDNWRDNPTVDAVRAKSGLMELANNVSTTNCTYIPGYFEALFDPLFNVSPRPFADHVVPGLVYFSDYDVGNEAIAYHDTRYKNTTYGGEGWNLGWTYRSDGVDISTCSTGNGFKVAHAEPGEWLKYTVRILHGGIYDLELRTATTNVDRQVQLMLDGADLTGVVALPQTAGWDDWQVTTVAGLTFTAGTHVLEVRMLTNAVDFSSMRFELAQSGFVDSDADQIDDHWEIRYGGDLDSGADPDLDGMSDLQEYYADTIPTNGASRLVSSILATNAAERIITSLSSTGRVYFLQYKTNLMTGSWSNLRTNVPGVGGVLSLLDTNNVANGFYRIGAGRP